MHARIAALLLVLAGIPAAANSILLENARVIDGHGGVPLENADVLIKGQRIVSVGAHGSAPVPPHTTRVDLSGKTVLPGLISDHSHLGFVKGTAASVHNITRNNILRQLWQYESYGVTTVTSLGLNTDLLPRLERQAHRAAIPGADIFNADRGIGVAGGAPPVAIGVAENQVYRPSTLEEARADVREAARRRPDLLKIWVDDLHGTAHTMNPEMYKAVIDEAHANGLRVAAHIFYLEDARQLVGAGIDVLAHGVRDKPVDAAFIQALKDRNVWYIPTLGVDESAYIFAEHPEWVKVPFVHRALQPALAAQFQDPQWRNRILRDSKTVAAAKQALATNQQNVKSLYDAGVRVGFGTDSGANPLRIAGFAEHRELKLLTDAGLTPLQAIQTATQNAAAELKLDDRGVLAPGKLADILVVAGDPSQDIAALDHIEAVWHRGRKVAGPLTRH